MFFKKNDNIQIEDEDDKELKTILDDTVLDELIDNFINDNSNTINLILRKLKDKDELKVDLKEYFNKKGYKFNNDTYDKFNTKIWGYGELQPLLEMDDITDIKVIGKTVRVKILGKRYTSKIGFISKKAASDYVRKIAVKNGITLSEINALQLVTDKESSEKYRLRIDFHGETVASDDHPYMHIRLHPKNKYLLKDLKARGMFDDIVEKHIIEDVKNGLSLLICGENGCGKTYLFNALLEEIPHDKSSYTAQESGELFTNTHPESVFEEIKTLSGESKVQYTLQDLLRMALVGDFDYLNVGEIKGAEGWDLANAVYTGSSSIDTVHAMSSISAIPKLVHYMKYSEMARDMKESDLLEILAGFDEIIFIDEFKIREITQIEKFDLETKNIIYNPVLKYDIKTGSYERLNDDCEKIKKKIANNKFKMMQQ